MNRVILLNLVLLLVASCPVEAGTITVKADGTGDYPTIQAAIDASVNGDEVVAEEGTYTGPGNRDIDFLGKPITVRSTDPNDANIVAATIIDCNGTKTEPHRGFKFHNGEDTDSILSGLTITNGYAPDELYIHWLLSLGGAVFCKNSSPIITNCNIINNFAYYYGGGIFCWKGSPTITNCTIVGNEAFSEGGGINGNEHSSFKLANCTVIDNRSHRAGGIYFWRSSPTITNCIVSDNEGGGISCEGVGSPIVTNCTIVNNSGVISGGIYFNVNGPWTTISNCNIIGNSSRSGGGISCRVGGIATIINCNISDNFADDVGGGIYGDLSNLILTNCTISGNTVYRNAGGGMFFSDSITTITNCTISGNSSRWGGGIYYSEGMATIANCTIIGNQSSWGGGISCRHYKSSLTITNCVLYDNDAPHGPEINLWDYTIAYVNYNDVQGGPNDVHIGHDSILNWGIGNIDADPCFVEAGYWADACDPNIIVEPNDPNAIWVEGDYHLLGNSPCIDTGDPNFVPEPNETDLDDNPRVVDGDNDGNSVVDMGAYEWMPTPSEFIAWLLEEVGELELPGGIENGLEAKLNAALGAVEDENENNDTAAVNTLEAFINAVEAQRGKKIPQAEADALIAAAQEIMEMLNTR